MPKFFRSFRIQAFMLNKIKNYLLYALGEIVLVVAGILIAVYIGEQRDKVKEEEAREKAITQVTKDLEVAIRGIEADQSSVEAVDSLMVLVLQNSPRLKAAPDLSILRTLTTNFWRPSLPTVGYDILLKNLTSNQSETDSLILLLNELYITYLPHIKNDVLTVGDLVNTNINYLTEHIPSFSKGGDGLSAYETNYYLNSWHFKNKILQMKALFIENLIFNTHVFGLEAFKTLAYIHTTHGQTNDSIASTLSRKFAFEKLTLQSPEKNGFYSKVDTLKNIYKANKWRTMMVCNSSKTPLRIVSMHVNSQKLEKTIDQTILPGAIGFTFFYEYNYTYFTDDKENLIGRVKIGKHNGYVEIK